MKPPAPLRHRDFRSLWTAGLISDSGDWLLLIAIPIVVYDFTGSALGMAAVFLVELLPGILLAPLAGRLADRWDRRRLLLTVSLLQAAALLPLWFVDSRADLPILYLVILVEAVLLTIFDPAKNALLPALLPAGQLMSANALIGMNQNLGRLIGGPLGGLLLATGNLKLIVVVDLISYGCAAVLIWRLDSTGPRTANQPQSGSEVVATGYGGFLTVLRSRQLRAGLLVALTVQIAQGIFVVLFIVFVVQRLHGGPAEIGLLRGVQAIGAIAGGVALALLPRNVAPGKLVAWAATAIALIELVLWNAPSLTTAWALYVALFILVGSPGIAVVTGLVSIFQRAVGEEERGRAFSALNLAINAGQGIGMLSAGLLTTTLGLLPLLNGAAVLYLVAGIIAARSFACMRVRTLKPVVAR
ncbi:MAG TPA: MFS transporter [Jatrophihabitans sp.]|jgi:MFS family permease|uniref:MFS transporter n=1 Tax=Jatrophihabitans sp. TaxID=1932789 RepID=UPI002EFC0D6A